MRVQCQCGWVGFQAELVASCCPRCGQQFKSWPSSSPDPAGIWYFAVRVGIAENPDGVLTVLYPPGEIELAVKPTCAPSGLPLRAIDYDDPVYSKEELNHASR